MSKSAVDFVRRGDNALVKNSGGQALTAQQILPFSPACEVNGTRSDVHASGVSGRKRPSKIRRTTFRPAAISPAAGLLLVGPGLLRLFCQSRQKMLRPSLPSASRERRAG